MTPDYQKKVNGRTYYYVPIAGYDSAAPAMGWANDGRPIRFVEISSQPSGDMAVYESAPGKEIRVKRLETRPADVADMLKDEFESKFPGGAAGMVIFRSGAGALTDKGKLIREYDKALSDKDSAGLARSVVSLYKLNGDTGIDALPPAAKPQTGGTPTTTPTGGNTTTTTTGGGNTVNLPNVPISPTIDVGGIAIVGAVALAALLLLSGKGRRTNG